MRKTSGLIFLALLAGLVAYYFYPEPKPEGTTIDKLIVLKSERKLLAFSNGKLKKTYTISLGRNPKGDKQYEGDSRTPEGSYTINDKNPNSGYHKNLGVSYPDSEDIRQAKMLGKPAGGAIKIHGLRNGTGFVGKFHRLMDWTQGCMAVTNEEVDELYSSVPLGTPILIEP
ncbi:hypothetical protein DC20_19410 [Rufibacter tibetensis]|uniref:L,D-TPase catalytic domain-containing protein n=2 Tax=Rufibacter tibetensis TaxID=512763 RepID=A0A0P0C6V4_9BACT|nr:hypothetical protein DC20_19410 [Rufibacter tibetensis]